MITPLNYSDITTFFNRDTFSAQMNLTELKDTYQVQFQEDDGDGLGVIEVGFFEFKGISVRVISYQDSPKANDVAFAFPDRTPNQSSLVEELCKLLKIKPYWITSFI